MRHESGGQQQTATMLLAVCAVAALPWAVYVIANRTPMVQRPSITVQVGGETADQRLQGIGGPAAVADAYQRRLSQAVELERSGNAAQAALTAARAARELAAAEEWRAPDKQHRAVMKAGNATESGAGIEVKARHAAAAAEQLAAAEQRLAQAAPVADRALGAQIAAVALLRQSALQAFDQVSQELQALQRESKTSPTTAGVVYSDPSQAAATSRSGNSSSALRF